MEKGVGSPLSPWQQRREASALRDTCRAEMLMKAQTKRDGEDVGAGWKQWLSSGELGAPATLPSMECVATLTEQPVALEAGWG